MNGVRCRLSKTKEDHLKTPVKPKLPENFFVVRPKRIAPTDERELRGTRDTHNIYFEKNGVWVYLYRERFWRGSRGWKLASCARRARRMRADACARARLSCMYSWACESLEFYSLTHAQKETHPTLSFCSLNIHFSVKDSQASSGLGRLCRHWFFSDLQFFNDDDQKWSLIIISRRGILNVQQSKASVVPDDKATRAHSEVLLTIRPSEESYI